MKYLICCLLTLFSFVSAAKADFYVSVSADGKEISLRDFFQKDSSLEFKDGIAAIKAYTADGGGIFFSIGEKFVQQLKADGYAVYGKSRQGVETNVGDVYFVIVLSLGDGEKIALVSPVYFSAFSVGLHASEKEIYHTGIVEFNYSWMSSIKQAQYKL
jgi:hypothetical protein